MGDRTLNGSDEPVEDMHWLGWGYEHTLPYPRRKSLDDKEVGMSKKRRSPGWLGCWEATDCDQEKTTVKQVLDLEDPEISRRINAIKDEVKIAYALLSGDMPDEYGLEQIAIMLYEERFKVKM